MILKLKNNKPKHR